MARLRRRQPGYSGDYASFAEAARACGEGYRAAAAIAYARTNTRPHQPQLLSIDLPVLAALQTVRPRRVLDFGGALGGHCVRLNHLVQAQSWRVVELPGTAQAGAAEFADGVLSFGTTLEPADVVLAGGVLQYLEDPYRTLRELATYAPHLIVDRVPLIERERLTIQRVDQVLFDGAVPAWFLSDARFRAETSRFSCVMSWEVQNHCVVLDGEALEPFRGFLFRTR